MATPIFHTLFSTKWDASIILFQILLLRGIFLVFSHLYNNYILSLGRSRMLVFTEALRDGVALVAILFTISDISSSTQDNPVTGLTVFLYGQLAAGMLTWIATLVIVSRITGRRLLSYLSDMAPYVALTFLGLVPCVLLASLSLSPLALCVAQTVSFGVVYIGVNFLMKSRIQSDVFGYILGRYR